MPIFTYEILSSSMLYYRRTLLEDKQRAKCGGVIGHEIVAITSDITLVHDAYLVPYLRSYACLSKLQVWRSLHVKRCKTRELIKYGSTKNRRNDSRPRIHD